jgi:VWFA-related protein
MPRSSRVRSMVIAASIAIAGAGVATQQNPTFRGRTDLLLLDVSVLDEKSRQPVRDLTTGDFTVIVDGQPRPVVAFKFVDMPPPPPPISLSTASWVREIAPDVVTNERAPGRVVAILIDDKSIEETRLGPFEMEKARQSALNVVDALGPDDRAAVVFSKNAHSAQSFTTDRQRLRDAIKNATLIPEPKDADPDKDPQCRCAVCSIEAITHVSRTLQSVSEQRKVLFFVSAGPLMIARRPPPLDTPRSGLPMAEVCFVERRDAVHDALRSAHAANVTIQSVDPTGLATDDTAKAETRGLAQRSGEPLNRQQTLRMFAEQTGGRAIVNSNDPDRQVTSLLAESSSYYLLGVEPPAPSADGTLHKVDVRVNRRDLDVRTRNGYYDPTAKDRATAAALKLDNGPLTPLIASPLPGAGLPLQVTAAPFAAADGKATIAVALAIGANDAATRTMPRVETVEVVASAYIPETADNAGWSQQKLSLTWSQPDPRFGGYEVLSRVSVQPGRYELRVGAKTGDGRNGSVYTSVEVPDFAQPLSLSGIVVHATPSPAVAPPDGLGDVLPFTPTARRTFQKTDKAAAFLRIYQRARTFSPTSVKTTITSTTGAVVAAVDERVQGAAAGAGSASDYEVDLPLTDLSAGEYLITITASLGNRTAQRQLRFRVE